MVTWNQKPQRNNHLYRLANTAERIFGLDFEMDDYNLILLAIALLGLSVMFGGMYFYVEIGKEKVEGASTANLVTAVVMIIIVRAFVDETIDQVETAMTTPWKD